MLRRGFTYRIYDLGPFTLALGGSFMCDGSHRWPKIDLIFRDRWFAGRSCTGGRAMLARRMALPLPYITFGRAWSWKRWGLLPVHFFLSRFYRRAFSAPR